MGQGGIGWSFMDYLPQLQAAFDAVMNGWFLPPALILMGMLLGFLLLERLVGLTRRGSRYDED